MAIQSNVIKAAAKVAAAQQSKKSSSSTVHFKKPNVSKNLNISIACLSVTAFILFLCSKFNIKSAASLLVILLFCVILPEIGVVIAIPIALLVYVVNYKALFNVYDNMSNSSSGTGSRTSGGRTFDSQSDQIANDLWGNKKYNKDGKGGMESGGGGNGYGGGSGGIR